MGISAITVNLYILQEYRDRNFRHYCKSINFAGISGWEFPALLYFCIFCSNIRIGISAIAVNLHTLQEYLDGNFRHYCKSVYFAGTLGWEFPPSHATCMRAAIRMRASRANTWPR